MIVNQSESRTISEEIRAKLAESPYQFYITGSRFFGGSTPQSDWDYFAQNDEKVLQFLQSLGFKSAKTNTYSDPGIKFLLIKEDVQVQLVSDAIAKDAVQKMITKYMTVNQMKSLTGHMRVVLWAIPLEIWKLAIETEKMREKQYPNPNPDHDPMIDPDQ